MSEGMTGPFVDRIGAFAKRLRFDLVTYGVHKKRCAVYSYLHQVIVSSVARFL